MFFILRTTLCLIFVFSGVVGCREKSHCCGEHRLARLAHTDYRLREIKSRRDFAIQTARKLEWLSPGDYSINETGTKCPYSFKISTTRPTSERPVWLVSASYRPDELTLRFNQPIEVNEDYRKKPFELFYLQLKGSIGHPSEVFELISKKPIVETPYGLVLPLQKKPNIDLEKFRVLPNWQAFQCNNFNITIGQRLADLSNSTTETP